MHVTVDLTAATAQVLLVEPEDCQRFDVVVLGPGDTATLDAALLAAAVGRTEEAGALVEVAAVRRLASGSVGDGWEADFVAMIEFARAKGWVTEDGRAIVAHVEWR
ncbi:MAG TPA: hypothetical protein VN799_09405 [Acidimicrobiales bacterium]|nr:hypothetical protein [Acidimicrobiales bacterium]